MGLKVPSSTLIYPKVFVNNLRKINTGHPEAAEQLVSDNIKEMNNPTRDGRAMINSGVHTIHADGAPATSGGDAAAIGSTIGYDRASRNSRCIRARTSKDGPAVQASKFSLLPRWRRILFFRLRHAAPQESAQHGGQRDAGASAISRRKKRKRSSIRSRRRSAIRRRPNISGRSFPSVVTEDPVNYCATVDAKVLIPPIAATGLYC